MIEIRLYNLINGIINFSDIISQEDELKYNLIYINDVINEIKKKIKYIIIGYENNFELIINSLNTIK